MRAKHPMPVFVLGEMRSGTNMLIECFERCFYTDVYNETNELAFRDYVLRDFDTISRLLAQSRATHVIFKALADSLRANEIFAALPDSRSIYIFRRYQDVVNSALRKWTQHERYLYHVLYEPERAGWRRTNLTEDDLRIIEFFYKKGLTDASARALIWYIRNRHFFLQGLDRAENVLPISYEVLVTDPALHLAHAFDFVELPTRDSYFAKIRATSIKRDKEPEIDPEIVELCEQLTGQINLVTANARKGAAAKKTG